MGSLRDPMEGRRMTTAGADHGGGKKGRGGMVMSGGREIATLGFRVGRLEERLNRSP